MAAGCACDVHTNVHTNVHTEGSRAPTRRTQTTASTRDPRWTCPSLLVWTFAWTSGQEILERTTTGAVKAGEAEGHTCGPRA
jgi:hypothetical protein